MSSVGGIAGYAWNSSNIANCTNSGSITGNWQVDGIIGYLTDDSTIENCVDNGTVVLKND